MWSGHLNQITALCMDSLGKLLASGCITNATELDQSALATVHVWKMPDLNGTRFSHQFIATGRAVGVREISGLSFSTQSQCLYGIGEDVAGRGLVLVWDVRVCYVKIYLRLSCNRKSLEWFNLWLGFLVLVYFTRNANSLRDNCFDWLSIFDSAVYRIFSRVSFFATYWPALFWTRRLKPI